MLESDTTPVANMFDCLYMYMLIYTVLILSADLSETNSYFAGCIKIQYCKNKFLICDNIIISNSHGPFNNTSALYKVVKICLFV